jgi:hypothetical protein
MLRTRPTLPGQGRRLVEPVHEQDVVATLVQALDGRDWPTGTNWYELVGPDRMTWAELAECALAGPHRHRVARVGAGVRGTVMDSRLSEYEPWATDFAVVPTRIPTWARGEVA